jgi:hypothetical protein
MWFGDGGRWTHELYVICEISCISVPVGPHGSLLVAVTHSSVHIRCEPEMKLSHTIANLDLHRRISLRDILHASHNL